MTVQMDVIKADPMAVPPVIAYFITPHGFGHASRASAIMCALQAACPGCHFVLFTTVPEIFFIQSGVAPFEYHALDCDVGMVQRSPLEEDLSGTCDRLDRMLPFDAGLVNRLADRMRQRRCSMVICDIAALGIVAASEAEIPSVLVENFTWDWMYEAYLHREPRFMPHQMYLSAIYRMADRHIQTDPLCRPGEDTLRLGPIGRVPKKGAAETRRQLGLAATDPMVLVSMGGVADRFRFLESLPKKIDIHLVIPGADDVMISHDQVTPLPTHSTFYHPDLIAAANVVVGKAGYSTIAEAYLNGIPFGYVKRSSSPESSALERFIVKHLPSQAISRDDYHTGRWIRAAMDLLQHSGTVVCGKNHAAAVARDVLDMLRPP